MNENKVIEVITNLISDKYKNLLVENKPYCFHRLFGVKMPKGHCDKWDCDECKRALCQELSEKEIDSCLKECELA